VRPPCSSFSRVVLSWSLFHCDLNSAVFSLAVRVLTFSTTLVTSELEAINHPLSSVQERPRIQFLVCTVQPLRGSGIPASRSSCSFFAHFGIAALYSRGPSLCLNLFSTFNSFILLLRAMACGVVCCCTNMSQSFGVIYPNRFSGDRPLCI
jgi:hypothetical protein